MARRPLHSQAYPASASAPALEHLTGSERGRLVALDREHATIGRTLDNDIVLESEAVSRCHARLHLEGGAVRISDNRSKNGVLVNGERVRDRILTDGDIVQLGNFLFRYHGDVRSEGASFAERGSNGGYGFGTPHTQHPMGPTQPYTLTPPGGVPGGYGDPFDPTRTAMQIAMAERRNPYFFYGMLAAVVVCGIVLIASRLGGPVVPSVVPPENATAAKGVDPVRQIDRSGPKAAAVQGAPVNPARPPLDPEEVEAPVVMPAPEPEAPEVDGPTVDQVAAMDDDKAIEIYMNEGREFLKRGEFEKAAQAFQIALVIDPRNATAMRGIRAAEFKAKDLESVPLESVPKVIRPRRDKPEKTKAEAKAEAAARVRNEGRSDAQKKAEGLLREARVALEQKKYSDVVRLGDEVRELDGKATGKQLAEAKQLAERAKSAQRDEFEPFVQQAKEMIGEGRAQSGFELCEEMLRRDPNYGPARECAASARRLLGGKK